MSLWELMTPQGMANLDPKRMVGRIYERNHYAVLQTKNIEAVGHMVSEKKIKKKVFPIISLWKQMNPLGKPSLD